MAYPAPTRLVNPWNAPVKLAAALLWSAVFSSSLLAGVQKPPLPGNCSTEAAAKRHPVCENVLFHGSRETHDIALTFDACPRKHVEAFSLRIVQYLKKEKIPATFFVSGTWAESCPECLRQLEDEPLFEIGLHGYSHKKSTGLSEEEIAGEIEKNRTALIRLGADPQPLFRPPYGDNPFALSEAARRMGVTSVMWDIGPDDPDPHHTPKYLEKVILDWAKGGSIVVMHVNGGGVSTADALPFVVDALKEKGFTFVKVSDLMSANLPGGSIPVASLAVKPQAATTKK